MPMTENSRAQEEDLPKTRKVCPTCHGSGLISYRQWARTHKEPGEAHPTDEQKEQPCGECGGAGYIYES